MKRMHFKDVTSTNDIAKSLIKVGETDILITADFQSKGRGKLGSVWFGEREKDLFLSFTYPVKSAEKLEHFAVISCVGVYNTLKNYGFSPLIKAPNDIYINDRKVCGILCEAEYFEKKAYMVIGVGLNIFSENFPEEISATSLLLEKSSFKCEIKKIGEEISEEIKRVFNENYDTVFAQYSKVLKK